MEELAFHLKELGYKEPCYTKQGYSYSEHLYLSGPQLWSTVRTRCLITPYLSARKDTAQLTGQVLAVQKLRGYQCGEAQQT